MIEKREQEKNLKEINHIMIKYNEICVPLPVIKGVDSGTQIHTVLFHNQTRKPSKGIIMSSGKKSQLFQPVNEDMLFTLAGIYPNAVENIGSLYFILTNNCRVETLQFVAIVDMISRAKKDNFDHYNGLAAMVMLSVMSKSGNQKYQTTNLELLHDVLVEVHMAGRNFKNLQKYLAKEELAYVSFHSCGSGITKLSHEDIFYDTVEKEQLMRTELDWSGTTEKNANHIRVKNDGVDAELILDTCERIVQNTELVLALNRSQSRKVA